jgi:cystathionine beta-synthase
MTAAPPVASSVLDMIGDTPLVEVTHLERGPCQLFLKLENQNPGGSIKDRIGKSMIEAAEQDGRPRRPPATPAWVWPWSPPRRAIA